MIFETADQNDKRSIRVSITKSGREEILRILPLMSKVSEIVVGNLGAEEIRHTFISSEKTRLFPQRYLHK